MNQEQYEIMKNKQGFIAALDQSGGSTPKALASYGILENEYQGETEMFKKVHEMRTRIITSPSFNHDKILGAILFENTMYSTIDSLLSADFLWDEKKIVPFLKIDKGLAQESNGVKLMQDIPMLNKILEAATDRNIFGTKMRSVIYENNEEGIRNVVKQQFDIAKIILEHDLMPIIEPEVDIHSENKTDIETKLKKEIFIQLDQLQEGQRIMLKLTPPELPDFYKDLIEDDRVLRLVFLSGGHSRIHANELLSQNHGAIASFSRALSEGLNATQSTEEFDEMLDKSIQAIFDASIT